MRFLFPCVLSVCCMTSSLPALSSADLIFHSGKIYTAEDKQSLQEAIAIENGKILAVGDDKDILRLKQPGTRVVDLQGKVMMPGLLDAHSHAIRGGLQLLSTDIDSQMVSIATLESMMREGDKSGKARRGDILLVNGFPSSYWSHLDELDKHFNQGEWKDRPIIFVAWDQHTGWANNTLLKRYGVTAEQVKALKGEAVNTIGHHQDGTPNGFLADAGLYSLMERLPPYSQQKLLKGAREALSEYHRLGVTGWMDPIANDAPGVKFTNASVGVLPIYQALAEKGELTAHVAALMLAPSKATPRDLDELDKVRQRYLNVPNLTIPGIKVFADGVAEYPAQTAAMLEPYRNTGKYGELLLDPATFGKLVTAADKRGWLVHIHAIGDRAVRASLDGIEEARKAGDSQIPHSITHMQTVNPQDFPRFKSLGVIAVMQLFWAAADPNSVDLFKPYVSTTAFENQYPVHSMIADGAVIAGASDWPVSTPSPWKAIYQGMTRKGPEGVLDPAEKLDRMDLFQAYTINAAKAMRLDKQIGSLEKGKQADLVILDRDIFTVSPEALRDTQVIKTYFAGQEVYTAPQPHNKEAKNESL
ncbi:N-substituted formamide deformylase precursor [Yokenella regensburgei]|uniref:N-substituted formamide deformylase n=2 Tax=Yokenella regensburgei TaxID=158877 RepID=A0AB38FSD4_9ENTR|nr:N-substituted formamide deformylase precursor [Yokenella regensburgei]SQA66973.1 N-substituted formamide deformylase precursor [Yokenella regensburgei]SUQ05417.1 N-substituted formamide deformylase precursor [Yokenella regensburgei]